MDAKQTARLTRWITATAAAAMLAACGGGGGGSPSETPAPAPAPAPTPAPAPAPQPLPVERIEPYDPGDVATKTATVAPRALASGQSVARVVMGPVAGGALPAPSAALGAAEPQIGVAREVPGVATVSELSSLLRWADTGRGTRVAALSVTAQGAKGVRLGVLVRGLPEGAVLRFYAQAGGAVVEVPAQDVLSSVARNLRANTPDEAAHTYWSPDFGGPETTMEVEIPATAAISGVRLAVPRLSHYVLAPDEAEAQGFSKVGEAGSCEVDVMCKPDYLSQSRSVARMIYVREGKSYLCSGTLLNDIRSSGTPYFLSAHHCISTQAEASSLITDWFYRSTACNTGTVNAGAQRRTGGATLLYATATTDTSFMRLNEAPPPGIVYAGSYFGSLAPGLSVAGVHHPKGDLQKFSQGVLLRFSTCSGETCYASNAENGTFLTLGWQQGVTEGGSSGSGLFYTIGEKRYVVGQLFGGASSCQNPAGVDQYGRFDSAYRNSIKQWLNP